MMNKVGFVLSFSKISNWEFSKKLFPCETEKKLVGTWKKLPSKYLLSIQNLLSISALIFVR